MSPADLACGMWTRRPMRRWIPVSRDRGTGLLPGREELQKLGGLRLLSCRELEAALFGALSELLHGLGRILGHVCGDLEGILPVQRPPLGLDAINGIPL